MVAPLGVSQRQVQNDTITYNGDILDALGEDDVVNNTWIIQPVLSIQLT